ncbi:ketopantoate reductase family protein [Paraburkholderia sp. BL18I3N2]|uniref:ketopantoate reductase family protein n=1 Tax=Paraburkholderia sp. BL18I3N2 TaxID=1938799 RepID=UPI0035BE91A7
MGAGAIGGFFAARLAKAGHDVSVLARGATLFAIDKRGLTLQSDGQTIHTRPRASDNANRGGAVGSDSQINFISGSAGVIKLPI